LIFSIGQTCFWPLHAHQSSSPSSGEEKEEKRSPNGRRNHCITRSGFYNKDIYTQRRFKKLHSLVNKIRCPFLSLSSKWKIRQSEVNCVFIKVIQLLYVSQKGWALLIHLSRSNRWINKADAIQTGCVQFQERVEGYQEVFVSFETEGWFDNFTI